MAFLGSLVKGFQRLTGMQSAIRQALEPVINSLGLTVRVLDNDGGSLLVRWEGEDYEVYAISPDGREAAICVQCKSRFPPNELPPDLCRELERQNKYLPNWGYQTSHYTGYSTFKARTWITVDGITPDVFRSIMQTLIPAIQDLDRLIRERGYATESEE